MDRTGATEDHYALLGVSQFASWEEIRDSYKRLALRFHPDKNKDQNATSDFQRLARAWETLKDSAKRREYDRNYVAERKTISDADRARKRREDIDRDVRTQWERTSQSPRKQHTSAEQIARLGKARIWKAAVKNDYLSRLQTWKDFRGRQIVLIRHYQILIRRHEQQLEEQTRENEDQTTRVFNEAIERSKSIGHQIRNHAEIIARLIEAKRIYIIKLREALVDSQNRMKQSIRELENGLRLYEDEEIRSRQYRIQEALEILGPGDYSTPLFSVIDRRRQAINYWKALLRVKKAESFCSSLEGSEGPWHEGGKWERVAGEYTCGRCTRPAFHIILDCGPAQCPRCGLIVCNDCHRDLELLREYEAWVVSVPDLDESLFSLEFEDGAGPIETWDSAGVGRCWG
jgi:curved DNA-binding protein CbpA